MNGPATLLEVAVSAGLPALTALIGLFASDRAQEIVAAIFRHPTRPSSLSFRKQRRRHRAAGTATRDLPRLTAADTARIAEFAREAAVKRGLSAEEAQMIAGSLTQALNQRLRDTR